MPVRNTEKLDEEKSVEEQTKSALTMPEVLDIIEGDLVRALNWIQLLKKSL